MNKLFKTFNKNIPNIYKKINSKQVNGTKTNTNTITQTMTISEEYIKADNSVDDPLKKDEIIFIDTQNITQTISEQYIKADNSIHDPLKKNDLKK